MKTEYNVNFEINLNSSDKDVIDEMYAQLQELLNTVTTQPKLNIEYMRMNKSERVHIFYELGTKASPCNCVPQDNLTQAETTAN